MQDSFYDQVASNHSVVDHYWHMTENSDGNYPLYTTVKWGFVFFRLNGKTRVTIVGPRTLPSTTEFKKGEYVWGIVFHGDLQLRSISKRDLLNEIYTLNTNTMQEFSIDNAVFKIPEYDQLEDFVDKLISLGIIYGAPIAAVSHRDKQRKIKRYTGLSPKQIEQANRVDEALALMSTPLNLAEIATKTNFADQSHMNRDFSRLVGYTPVEIRKFFNDVPQ